MMSEPGSGAPDRGPPSIEVALATCNSERFLAPLLDSLFGQTCQAFTLLVADDGSTDATPAILADYAALHPGRIRRIGGGDPRRGALQTFALLIDALSADYALLCDHDDVWLPDKIAISLAALQAIERRRGAHMPVLLHTDLTVVGPELELIAASAFRYQRIDPARNSVPQLLLANTATGCATIVNRALYARARPVPPQAMMHDHWLALTAAALGEVAWLAQSTILYRQHGANVIGAARSTRFALLPRIRELLSGSRHRTFHRSRRQAAALLERFGAEMRPGDRRATRLAVHLTAQSRWTRFARLWREGLRVRGMIGNLFTLVVVTTARRREVFAEREG